MKRNNLLSRFASWFDRIMFPQVMSRKASRILASADKTEKINRAIINDRKNYGQQK